MEILTVRDLSFTYPLCEEPAIHDVSFSIERGEFISVIGATGSGKSTLMRLLKRELQPAGELSGEILFEGQRQEDLSDRDSACRIGYVMQRPDEQLVTDKVWHELAFGLENMGVPQEVIRRRVSEMACYFGIEGWFRRSVSELSGGQKQLLNLAAVMVMQPDVLLLDEPTAQLDPIAAADFIATLSRLNRDLSLTVVIIEHRLEEVLSVSDRVLALRNGGMLAFGETREAVRKLAEDEQVLPGLPSAVRLWRGLDAPEEGTLTVKEGRALLENAYRNDVRTPEAIERPKRDTEVLSFSEVFFRYGRKLPDVLRGLSFSVNEGELFCLLGGNGSGKSTALSVAAGFRKAYAGKVKLFGKKIDDYKGQSLYDERVAILPQDVQTVFLRNTVREELEGVPVDELPFDLSPLYDRHPYDLSGGQQQLLALARVLGTKPRLLLLDEPTKGLDAYTKLQFTGILKDLQKNGVTILCVTHDVEFAADCADRCALFFDGEITSCDVPEEFFSGNNFYTTAANRMTRGYYDGIFRVREAVDLCQRNGRKEGAC